MRCHYLTGNEVDSQALVRSLPSSRSTTDPDSETPPIGDLCASNWLFYVDWRGCCEPNFKLNHAYSTPSTPNNSHQSYYFAWKHAFPSPYLMRGVICFGRLSSNHSLYCHYVAWALALSNAVINSHSSFAASDLFTEGTADFRWGMIQVCRRNGGLWLFRGRAEWRGSLSGACQPPQSTARHTSCTTTRNPPSKIHSYGDLSWASSWLCCRVVARRRRPESKLAAMLSLTGVCLIVCDDWRRLSPGRGTLSSCSWRDSASPGTAGCSASTSCPSIQRHSFRPCTSSPCSPASACAPEIASPAWLPDTWPAQGALPRSARPSSAFHHRHFDLVPKCLQSA